MQAVYDRVCRKMCIYLVIFDRLRNYSILKKADACLFAVDNQSPR